MQSLLFGMAWQHGLLASIAALILYIFYQRMFHPLARVPGPFLASISRLWLTKLSWIGGAHEVLPALHKKHGPLVRIAPNEVSIGSAAAYKKIYAVNSGFVKSDFYAPLQGQRKFDLVAERNEEIHAKQRRLVSASYSLASLKDLEEYVDNNLSDLFKQLEKQDLSNLEIGHWIEYWGFDVISDITFSRRMGFIERGTDGGAVDKIHGVVLSASWVGQVPWLYRLHELLVTIIRRPLLAVANRHGKLRDMAVKEVTERKERGTDRSDMLSKWLKTHDKDPRAFDMTDVMSIATTNIFAGADTTGTQIRGMLYHILKNPNCKDRLVAEIDERARRGQLSDPVKFDEANNMPYLQACINEGVRFQPVGGMTKPRIVPAGGIQIEEHFIPAGSTVGASPWVINRDKNVYGADADTFNPERWLQDNTVEMHRTSLTFGSGSRNCIGKNIAWLEMSKFLATLFLRYNVELVHPEEELKVESWFFTILGGLHVRMRARQAS